MLLIADSGSTKTEWLLADKNKENQIFVTQGMNPYFVTEADIFRIIKTELKLNYTAVTELFFYGSGCGNEERKKVLHKVFKSVFTKAEIIIEHDMLGAARALCGHEPGIAAILGTGSNSCLYDGKNIKQEGNSLGYVLGDEGSGATLGKKLISDFLYHELPEKLSKAFTTKYKTDKAEILAHVYKDAFPNRYLASFVPFISENMQDEYCVNLVRKSFTEFINRHIKCYKDYNHLPVNITGSVGYYFFEEFKSACQQNHISTGKFIKNPIQGLYQYHSNN
jgi:glucosamine kinase